MFDISFSAAPFKAQRLQLEPADETAQARAEAVWKSHLILSRLAAHKHYFTDFTRGCDGECAGFCRDLKPSCRLVKHRVVNALIAKDAILWEVWRQEPSVDLVGILRLSELEPGCSAKAHYMFFDGSLKDKTPILLAWRAWVFDKLNLNRVTIEVPTNAFVLAKHAVKYLGFGGPYEYEGLPVEGVLRKAKILDGEPLDIMILGYTK